MRKIMISRQDWPVAGQFRIARSALTSIPTLRVTIEEDGVIGRGECRPYARYGEDCESVRAQIETLRPALEGGASQRNLSRVSLQTQCPAGAARNALDCALWDLEAKQSGQSVSELLGLSPPRRRETAYTLSIDTTENMAKAAINAKAYNLLKIKIGAENGLESALAIMNARPDARLIIDANEALSISQTQIMLETLQGKPVVMIEQPFKRDETGELPTVKSGYPPLILCADEAFHTREDLDRVWDQGYRAVNVKLDKCGGLTEGLAVMQAAKAKGFKIMAGCMVGSSLAMSPMMMLERFADVIDLDGPLLLAKDIENGLSYDGPMISAPSPALWG